MHPTITTDQGPSAHNQTSDDHSHDTNQKARQPSTADILEAQGLDTQVHPGAPTVK